MFKDSLNYKIEVIAIKWDVFALFNLKRGLGVREQTLLDLKEMT